MNNDCAFSRLHPLTLFLWFALVLAVTVLTVNPAFAFVSLLTALAFSAVTERVSVCRLAASLLFMILITLINPLFSHHGVTVLFFLNGLPVTLEAILFGTMMSVVVMSSFLWCGALSRCMTSDKVIWLFGRPFPKLAVLVSLTLRLIPTLRTEYADMKEARMAAGLYDESSPAARVSSSLKIFSALVTMILEDSIDTADSMKARGIMLKRRSCSSVFRFRRTDAAVTLLTLISAFVIAAACASGAVSFAFYPAVSPLPGGILPYSAYTFFAVTALIPSLFEVSLWKQLHSTAYRSNTPTEVKTPSQT